VSRTQRSSATRREIVGAPVSRTLLGGLTAHEFLARHWQRHPLLVRGAWPGFCDPASVSDLYRFAARDDCESRLVIRDGRRWTLAHGPFRAAQLRRMPARRWTLLVQGLNHFLPAADRLLRAFRFVPYARLDDLMASYAADGGGVGPHFDSYDVFLLQGRGRRRWRISAQCGLELDPRAPLRILRGFRAAEEWILEPGDMLYLPPGVAHEGTALGACMTYSIGFRSPSARELGREFLAFLEDRLDLGDERYADPGRRPSERPARIGDALVAHCAAVLRRMRWRDRDVAAFLGRHLSEPKPHVRFSPPRPPLGARAFERAARRAGVRLSGRTGMLFRRGRFYVNGESVAASGRTRALLERLADDRVLPRGTSFTRAAAALLYTWYRSGYLEPGGAPNG
jgi:50S ribosomal protein L16 3-hydroxylase